MVPGSALVVVVALVATGCMLDRRREDRPARVRFGVTTHRLSNETGDSLTSERGSEPMTSARGHRARLPARRVRHAPPADVHVRWKPLLDQLDAARFGGAKTDAGQLGTELRTLIG